MAMGVLFTNKNFKFHFYGIRGYNYYLYLYVLTCLYPALTQFTNSAGYARDTEFQFKYLNLKYGMTMKIKICILLLSYFTY